MNEVSQHTAAVLSPKALAEAIGVSESSIKRWVDQGEIRADRTAGGHRRIRRSEAVRFLRERGLHLLRPDLLGLEAPAARVAADPAEALFEQLRSGAGREVRSALLGLYLSGWSIADLADGPIASAMRRIGELWREAPDGVFHEHRATDLCVQAVQEIRLLLPEPSGSFAVGGAPPGDPYLLPSLLASTVLAAEGLRATNLGPETPLETLRLAGERLGAILVWVSVTSAPRHGFDAALGQLGASIAGRGGALAIGGQQSHQVKLPAVRWLCRCGSMAELAAFGRGLARAAG